MLYLKPIRAWIGRKRGNTNFVLSTVSTKFRLEHSQKNSKNNSKNFKKKCYSGFVSSQTRPGEVEEELKFFFPNTISTRPELEHYQKYSKKSQKIKKEKGHFGFISRQSGPG